jgi:hypothetical protein
VGFAGPMMTAGPRVGGRGWVGLGQGLEPKLDRLAFRNSFVNRFSFSSNSNNTQLNSK